MRVTLNWGYFLGGPHNKDYIILGSILSVCYLGKLPHELLQKYECRQGQGNNWIESAATNKPVENAFLSLACLQAGKPVSLHDEVNTLNHVRLCPSRSTIQGMFPCNGAMGLLGKQQSLSLGISLSACGGGLARVPTIKYINCLT